MEHPICPPPSWRPGVGADAMQRRRASCSGADGSSLKQTSLVSERQRRASCYSRRQSEVERSFLQLCFGEAAGDGADEEVQEAGAGEAQDAGHWIRYLLNVDDSEDELPDNENPELEGMYAFDMSARAGGSACWNMSLDDSFDAGEEGSLGSYEDAFDFDMRKVADAVKGGAPEEEVSALIQAEMFQSLQERLQSGPSEQEDSAAMLQRDAARPCMSEDLSGMMTPPPGAAAGAVDGCEVEAKLQDVLAGQSSSAEKRCAGMTPARRRRSSIAQHPQLLEAVGTAASHHRRSLAEAVETELGGKPLTAQMAGRIRQSLVGMQRERRASLIKAAEVLEQVGVGTAGSRDAPEEVGAKLQLVQKAVECAWRRHRASVATALEAASRNVVSPANVRLMPCQTLTQERVNNVIAAAYEKHRARHGCKGSGPTHFRALMSTRLVTNMPGKSAYTVHCGPAPPARRPGSKRC
eukprot:TRINITY_DN24511_c0_g1_i1.p1 TRINITY_DN24511_c0_g1~~TRINITY_DN24511_c0_g1_i1.p1  ORF type:complete len:475 (-),score=98.53 TRINITY_DN24511_c0_g1_i1:33-1430(-)